jgi:hypothetical protein
MCYVPVTKSCRCPNRGKSKHGYASVTRPVFLPVIIDTPRQGRLTGPAANFVFGEVLRRIDIETELIDIKNR